ALRLDSVPLLPRGGAGRRRPGGRASRLRPSPAADRAGCPGAHRRPRRAVRRARVGPPGGEPAGTEPRGARGVTAEHTPLAAPPPYPELDRVLEAYVEEDRSLDELSADGFDPDVVARAVALIDRSEYKRRQAPPGVRLRPKAFGRDRRTPITNRWRS